MIVVVATVIAPALADDDIDGKRVRNRLRGEQIIAPELLDLEVVSVLRKAVFDGKLDRLRADLALIDLADLSLGTVSHRLLLPRIWELHQYVTPYNAAYVALSEAINVPLVTAERHLAQSPGLRCVVECLDNTAN